MTIEKIDQPPEHWDRLFANVGQVAMITTGDREGRINAATFATCVRCTHLPVQISFAAEPTRHTYQNILKTREFVVNLAAFEREILEKACILGLTFAPGVNELEKAGLTALPSRRVKPPRIRECHRHFECELVWTKEWDDRAMIVGNVVAASVDSDCVDERGFVIWDRVKPVQYAGSPYQRYVDEPPYKHVFLAAYESMAVETTYDGPEAADHNTIVLSGEKWR
jgi:flavin reductase (DIM6/NTAB) family NADH-FMN oxidoreductase RutF